MIERGQAGVCDFTGFPPISLAWYKSSPWVMMQGMRYASVDLAGIPDEDAMGAPGHPGALRLAAPAVGQAGHGVVRHHRPPEVVGEGASSGNLHACTSFLLL